MQTRMPKDGEISGFAPQNGKGGGKSGGRIVPLACLGLIGLLLLAGCNGAKPELEVAKVLTSGKWGREVEIGTLAESYVYTFNTNGTYKISIYNDFGIRALKGDWRVTRGSDGSVQLHLTNEEAYYHCLWRESKVRYESNRDVLVVEAGRITGAQELRHLRLTNRESELRPRKDKPRSEHDRLGRMRSLVPRTEHAR